MRPRTIRADMPAWIVILVFVITWGLSWGAVYLCGPIVATGIIAAAIVCLLD
jgi:hypothetical protein